MKMKPWKYLILTLIFLVPTATVRGANPTADEILRRVDEHCLISNDFSMTIRAESFLNNRSTGTTVMNGDIANNGKAVVITFLEPANLKGRKIIINDRDMQLVIPKVKNPIHITASQRLAGGVSYGDIIGVSYAQNYIAKIDGEETIAGLGPDGNKTNAGQCFVLDLTAVNAGSNYHKIILWVAKENLMPVKADFFTLSGKKMSTVYYAAPKKVNGGTVVTKMFLFDQINIAKHYAIEYLDIK
jgi:outer membrane lipoprotein-sorting protein